IGLVDAAMKSQNYSTAEQLVAIIQKDHPGALEASYMKDAPAVLAQWRARQSEEAAKKRAPAPTPAPVPVAEAKAAAPAESAAPAPVIDIRRDDGSVVEPGSSAQAPRRRSKAEAVAEEAAAEDAADAAQAATPAPEPVRASPPPALIPPPAPVSPALAQAREAARAEKYDEAVRLYRACIAKDNQDAVAWNEFSVVSLKAGVPEQALAASLEATRIAPFNLDYAIQYLLVVQKVYAPRRAMNEIIAMKRRFPDSPVITLALARAYWQVEQNAILSRAMYDDYLSHAPRGSNVDAVRAERDALPSGF
ncbi:MAG TPA: hypothetical protein PKI32_07395, partial [Opitutales bacterium]|nr:hypothetical protein [Opitutales bacterium]